MPDPRTRLYPRRPGDDVPAVVPRRHATADETWVGLTAPVTRMLDDGTFERYDIPVECWIAGDRARPKPAPEPAPPPPRETVPTYIDVDGVPVFVLS